MLLCVFYVSVAFSVLVCSLCLSGVCFCCLLLFFPVDFLVCLCLSLLLLFLCVCVFSFRWGRTPPSCQREGGCSTDDTPRDARWFRDVTASRTHSGAGSPRIRPTAGGIATGCGRHAGGNPGPAEAADPRVPTAVGGLQEASPLEPAAPARARPCPSAPARANGRRAAQTTNISATLGGPVAIAHGASAWR